MIKVVLTPAEHNDYVHELCGRTGIELEEIVKVKKTFCSRCPQLKECLRTHTVPEWEN